MGIGVGASVVVIGIVGIGAAVVVIGAGAGVVVMGIVGIGAAVVVIGAGVVVIGIVGIGAAVVVGTGAGPGVQGILGSQHAILGHSQRTRFTLQCKPAGQFISHLIPLLHL